MKNHLKYKEGDEVIIIHTHSDDLGKTGIITCVRPSFCKVVIDNKERNHTYGQIKKVPSNKEEMNGIFYKDILEPPKVKVVLKRLKDN